MMGPAGHGETPKKKTTQPRLTSRWDISSTHRICVQIDSRFGHVVRQEPTHCRLLFQNILTGLVGLTTYMAGAGLAISGYKDIDPSNLNSTFPWNQFVDVEQVMVASGYNQMFRIVCVWPFGHLDYGSAMLRCKI